MTPLFQLLPITVPPVADGFYIAVSISEKHPFSATLYWENGEWIAIPRTPLKGYLSPIPEEQVRKMLGDAFDAGQSYYSDMKNMNKTVPDRETFINEYLKQM